MSKLNGATACEYRGQGSVCARHIDLGCPLSELSLRARSLFCPSQSAWTGLSEHYMSYATADPVSENGDYL